jgi:spoIIIJ-associated protein
MEWVETTGRTIEEAKDAALDQLGVDESDAEFVIVSEPKPGLFGRMRGEARVRARVTPTSPRPKRGRNRRQDSRRGRSRSSTSQGGQGRSASQGGGVATLDEDDDTDEGESPERAGGNGGAPGAGRAQGAGTGTGTGQRSRNRRRRGGRGSGSGGANAQAAGGGDQAGSAETARRSQNGQGGSANGRRQGGAGRPREAEGTREEPVGETLSLAEQGESAKEFIAGLVRELGLSAEVSVHVIDEETAEVAVDGPELGILVGPGGATLAALQELARTVVQKRTGGHSDRILVDVAGYRARRADALQRFTRKVADEVLASGEERALEPMSAADRKVVHDTVNDIDGVVTRSEGEDPRRHIVISPAAQGGADAD